MQIQAHQFHPVFRPLLLSTNYNFINAFLKRCVEGLLNIKLDDFHHAQSLGASLVLDDDQINTLRAVINTQFKLRLSKQDINKDSSVGDIIQKIQSSSQSRV